MTHQTSEPYEASEADAVGAVGLTFEAFVTATAGRLLRTALFLVYDRHLAEDLVQSAYERVARRWNRVRQGVSPEAYARRVLVNLAIDERGRRARLGMVPAGSAGEMEALAVGVDAAGVEEDPATRALFRGALRTLPVKQRAVIVLRYWCDLSEQEIADTLGISRGTVKSHASRALTALRAQVGAEEVGSGGR